MPKRKCSNVNKTFGQNLIKYRKLCNYTQQQVADILSLNRTTYTKYETGVSEPSFEILKKICAIYGVDVNAIIGDDTYNTSLGDPVLPLYSLSKEEQEIVGIYRMFSKDEREKFFEVVNEMKEEKNNNF